MQNVLDYVLEEQRSMKEFPFSEVDSLVLSELAYMHIGNVPQKVSIKDLFRTEEFASYFEGFDPSVNNRLLLAWCAASPRYRDLQVLDHESHFDEKEETQFSATTFLLPDHSLFIAYRGTDNSFVGWKEDFNMAFLFPVPSQEQGLRYLEKIAGSWKGKITLGGHSKGGNTAQYAASFAGKTIQERIQAVYSHDGPGFTENIFASEGYLAVADKMHKTVPQSSLIGMLLEHHGPYTAVESCQNDGIMQHDPFSWRVEQSHFVPMEMQGQSIALNKGLYKWLCSLDEEKRKKFVDSLYHLLVGTGAPTMIGALSPAYAKKRRELLRAMDDETRRFMTRTIALMVKYALPSLLVLHPRQLQKNDGSSTLMA